VIIAHATGTDRSVPEQDHLCRLSRKAARRKLTGVSRRGSGAGPVLMAGGRGSNRTLSARATTRLRNAFDRSRLASTIGAAFLAADSRETRHAPASAGSPSMSDPSPKGGAPPQCDKCHGSTRFVMTIPLVSEPGRVLLFECDTCGKIYSVPRREHPAGAGFAFVFHFAQTPYSAACLLAPEPRRSPCRGLAFTIVAIWLYLERQQKAVDEL
jgi:hypothetical protein